ncbi:HAMP domain-containing histidine kinase [Halobacteria archaeon AArc-dxtr1]|nr:HAMP domain-containing histidine kinase [Halobacteria archaeon AArc-dxtr1]
MTTYPDQQASSVTRGDRSHFTVLYVDPNSDRRESVAASISPPYSVRAIPPDGTVSHQPVNCVVSTALEPVVDGDLAAELGSETPVVLFTASRDPETFVGAIRADVHDVVFRSERPDARALETLSYALDTAYESAIDDIADTVLDVAGSLMSAAPDEIDTKIRWGLRVIATELDAEACQLYRVDDETLVPTHGWAAAETAAFDDAIDTDDFPGFETLSSFENYAVPDCNDSGSDRGSPLSDARTDGESHVASESLEAHDIGAFFAAPVVIDWQLEHVIAVYRRSDRGWPTLVRREVRTVGELVGHTLRREARRRELERQNERLERFTSVLRHDITNPLNIIEGYTELARQTGDLEHLANVESATDRIRWMLDDLLTLAEAGTDLGGCEPVSVGELARATWDGVDTGNATLETNVDLTVEGDRGRLQQVFENLYRNAAEHAGDAVTVAVVETDCGFAVEDDGPGISESDRITVFEEGYTSGGGTGLGLSIVERVVDAHGWTVEVTAGRDGGARFEVDVEH